MLFLGTTTLLSLIKPWIDSRSQNTLSVIMTHVSILLFCLFILRSLSKFLKSFHVLASKCLLNLLTKLNSLVLKISFLLRAEMKSFFILYSSCNLGYIGKTRRRPIARLDEHRRKVKHEEIYSSFIISHWWSYNYYFNFTKVCIVSSPISTSHLNFHKAFYCRS